MLSYETFAVRRSIYGFHRLFAAVRAILIVFRHQLLTGPADVLGLFPIHERLLRFLKLLAGFLE